MNYIKELNAFYDWLELNELSPSAINLWYALMHINNKAGWIETFTVAESVLCVKTGLTERTLRKVRNELKQKGRIDFISRKGGRTPIYNIISFYSSTENISVVKKATEINSSDSVTGSVMGSVAGSVVDSSTLIKQNKTKQNETKSSAATRANYFDQYMLCFGGQPSAIQIQEINSFIDEDGLSNEVICLSFKKAAEVGAKYPYARSILKSWATKRILTVKDVENEKFQHEQKKQTTGNQSRRGVVPIRKEKIPIWFDEEEQPKEKQPNTTEDKELKELLKEFKKA